MSTLFVVTVHAKPGGSPPGPKLRNGGETTGVSKLPFINRFACAIPTDGGNVAAENSTVLKAFLICDLRHLSHIGHPSRLENIFDRVPAIRYQRSQRVNIRG